MQTNRKEALAILGAVKPGLDTKEVIEQSDRFAFHDGNVITYNDEIAVAMPGLKGLEGAVPAAELMKLLQRMTDETLDISQEGDELIVKAKRKKAVIKVDQEIKFPVDQIVPSSKWKPLPEDFTDALKFCDFAVGTDMTKPKLTCIHLNGNWAESCDTFRLARFKIEGKGFKKPLLITGSAAKELARYPVKEYQHANKDGWAFFRTKSKLLFSCRVFNEDTYPDLAVWYKGDGEKVKLPKAFTAAIDKASIFTETEGGFSQDAFVSLTVADGKLSIGGKSEVGSYAETCKIDYKGGDFEFHINPGFLLDMIKAGGDTLIVCDAFVKIEGDGFICSTGKAV